MHRAIWLFIVCGILFLGPGLPAAEAHAELVSAYPPPGATLASTPPEIRLTFSERIGAGSGIQLYGPLFRAVSGVPSGVDPAAPEQLRAFPPELAPDTYTVEWRAISADGHEVTGSYAFAITEPARPKLPPVWMLLAASAALLAVGGAAWTLTQRARSRAAGGARPDRRT